MYFHPGGRSVRCHTKFWEGKSLAIFALHFMWPILFSNATAMNQQTFPENYSIGKRNCTVNPRKKWRTEIPHFATGKRTFMKLKPMRKIVKIAFNFSNLFNIQFGRPLHDNVTLKHLPRVKIFCPGRDTKALLKRLQPWNSSSDDGSDSAVGQNVGFFKTLGLRPRYFQAGTDHHSCESKVMGWWRC